MTLQRLAGFLVRTLATQFLLGMLLNLYVTFPLPSPLTTAALLGAVVLILHIALGVGALAISLRMVIVASRSPGRRGLGLSDIAAAGLIVAFLSGMSFTFGDQSNTASLIMTVSFYIALMAGALLLGAPLEGSNRPSGSARENGPRATAGADESGVGPRVG
ncbi:MAG TPA: hypothetical protein VEY12_00605 [Thermoplasmata archaeon]|nr:hypothetical protein [Thermoplasmata archaeon]